MGKIMRNKIEYGGGGGGNANERTVTWLEYNALTEEEKMNGTTYYVYDVNGDGQNFQPVIYSNEEREIGVWTDGKPLYQKTFTTTTPSTVDLQTIVADVTNFSIDTIVNINGFLYCTSMNQFIPIEFPFSTNVLFSTWLENQKIMQMVPTSDYTNCTESITLQYTKTTDTPGSGTWTPQGVPAVHYDGNEKVVGTWFGETLYEKTLYYASKSHAHNDWVELDTMVIAMLIDVDTTATNNGRQLDEQYFRISYLNGKLYYHTPESSSTFYDIYVTLRYTKTT